jgi:large subunit ribosomal protein L33
VVEHFLGKEEATGSIPVAGSRKVQLFKVFKRLRVMAKNRKTTHLVCEVCKERNYTQVVSKKRTIGSLKLSKYCFRCRKHNDHKETK